MMYPGAEYCNYKFSSIFYNRAIRIEGYRVVDFVLNKSDDVSINSLRRNHTLSLCHVIIIQLYMIMGV